MFNLHKRCDILIAELKAQNEYLRDQLKHQEYLATPYKVEEKEEFIEDFQPVRPIKIPSEERKRKHAESLRLKEELTNGARPIQS